MAEFEIINGKRVAVRGGYIVSAMKKNELRGDSFVAEDELYELAKKELPGLTYLLYRDDLHEQIARGNIKKEGTRLYVAKTWRYEESTADHLAKILQDNQLCEGARLHSHVSVLGIPLCQEQLEAVELAVTHRLSVVLGGAGCGKTTLIRAIFDSMNGNDVVLCAPTGKAARNLTERTGAIARTVHSALGMHPGADFLTPVCWSTVRCVVVDEASMVSLEMLAGLLSTASRNCRIVLIGDPNQLLSVGSGNVIYDLLRLGIPHKKLSINHRQDRDAEALFHNVVQFDSITGFNDLGFDESFCFESKIDYYAEKALAAEAVKRYKAGESIQVLTPFRASAAKLNRMIQGAVNPPAKDKRELRWRDTVFRDGDRVMILENDRQRCCCNGDLGIFRVLSNSDNEVIYAVELSPLRCPCWEGLSSLQFLSLAYAITVHKSQGSQWDTILLAVTQNSLSMMYRNLIYTAVSRAKQRVLLYGSEYALDEGTQRNPPERRSMLVAKTNMRRLAVA